LSSRNFLMHLLAWHGMQSWRKWVAPWKLMKGIRWSSKNCLVLLLIHGGVPGEKKLYNPPSPSPEKHHHIMTERGGFTVSTLSLADKFRNYMKFISKRGKYRPLYI
jgi:hypothetical protein